MAKKFTIRAPKSVKLHEMGEREIKALVEKEAGKMLDNMPAEYRPVGVNAVSVDQLIPGNAQDVGGWAQWTRACCDRRRQIEDFTDPMIQQIEPLETSLDKKVLETHFESQFRIIELENPQMHGKPKK